MGCLEKFWIPIPGSVQDQVGKDLEQPGLMRGVSSHVPLHGREVGAR